MTQIIERLRASGETITEDELARLSPLAFAHVIPNGTSFVRPAPLADHGEGNGHRDPLDVAVEVDV
jgi:hypothetical protein